MSELEPLDVTSSAGRLAASVAVTPRAPAAVVLCHGLPSGAPQDPDDPGYPGLARELAGLGLTAATFSFRGCYGSEGDFSIGGWVEDLRAVVDAVRERAEAPIAVVGSSLGGATALCEAADDPRVGLVATLAAPASLGALASPEARDAFLERMREIGLVSTPGFPASPEGWAAEFDRCRPADSAGRLGDRPLLILHGDADDTVPVEHARDLAAAATARTTVVVLHGAGHRLRRDPAAVRVLFAWLIAHASGGYRR